MATTKKWAGQVRKGDVLLAEGQRYKIARVEPVMGGSWFNLYVEGHETEPVAFGHREQVDIETRG